MPVRKVQKDIFYFYFLDWIALAQPLLNITFFSTLRTPTNLSHLCQVQGRPLLQGFLRPPPLHRHLLVVEHARLRAAAGQSTAECRPSAAAPAQLRSGIWGAGFRCLLALDLRQADLLVGERQGPQEVVVLEVLLLLLVVVEVEMVVVRRRGGGRDGRGGELRVGG